MTHDKSDLERAEEYANKKAAAYPRGPFWNHTRDAFLTGRASRDGEVEELRAEIKQLQTGGVKFREEAERRGAERMLEVVHRHNSAFTVDRDELWKDWEFNKKRE